MRSWTLKQIELQPYHETLVPGDKAMLHVCLGNNPVALTSVWVRVFATLHNGAAYISTVESAPDSIADLNVGDEVTFSQRHIVNYKKAQ